MKDNKIAVGLDIGTTKIVAMIGRRNDYDKLEILGVGRAKSLGVKRGVVSNITQTVESIKQAIEDAENDSGNKIDSVVVGIAGEHIESSHHNDYITRDSPDEVINDDDIDNLINQVYKLGMQPGEEIIHVLPQEFKVDSQADITEPIGMYGGRLEANFHLVIGQVSLIKNIGRCVKSAGLDLCDITLEPLASAAAVLSQEEKEAGVVLVDMGGGTTDLAIFKDGIIRHTAVIPFGGNIITEDIKEGCSIIERQAELLKIRYGSAWPSEHVNEEIVEIPGLRGRENKRITIKFLSKVIYARVQEIIELVYLQIKNYRHEERKRKLIAGIVLTGGGSQLKHLRQLVEYITGMDVRIGYPNEHLAADSDDLFSSPLYATVIGLLMEGLGKKVIEKEDVEPKPEENIEIKNGQEENKVVKKSKKDFEKFKEWFSNWFNDSLEKGE